MKRFLLATDLSARSDRALDKSLGLAALHNAHLTILHVIDEDLPKEVQTQLADAAETQIEAFMAKADMARDVDVSVCVTPGREHLTIVDAAERDGCDLIILGRHRDETADRPLRGTTMERVLRQGQTPVLVVTDRADGPYASVMVGVDFSVFSRIALKVGLAVAPRANFHIVHAFQVPFEGFLSGGRTRSAMSREREATLAKIVNEEMNSLLQVTGPGCVADARIQRVIRDGEVISVLRSEAARIKPDLIVIGTHGRVGIAHALLGSVAENLLNHPPCDVLAVKAW